VEVRVIVDDIGARYTWPSIARKLKAAHIPLARFLPTLVFTWSAYANLRTHRKLLIVDGRIGFTGGMNIREEHAHQFQSKHFTEDLHFRIEGPVVAHLMEVFADDWAYCTDEVLQGEKWFPQLDAVGDIFARGISAGPDGDYDKLHLTLLGAVSCAQQSISIVTPYFLPDEPLMTALNVAALRGVEVNVILPENNNLTLVKWASTAQLWQVLEHGCRVWMTTGDFDHTKLMIVDGAWSFFGSANWDTRSLRLNFEFNVECYNEALAERLGRVASDKLAKARQITLAEVDGRKLPVRLRDGVARLLTPYL
jgi:cardiolipin synthase